MLLRQNNLLSYNRTICIVSLDSLKLFINFIMLIGVSIQSPTDELLLTSIILRTDVYMDCDVNYISVLYLY